MLLFLVDLIHIEIFRISFSLFYSFSFILRSRATSKQKAAKAMPQTHLHIDSNSNSRKLVRLKNDFHHLTSCILDVKKPLVVVSTFYV